MMASSKKVNKISKPTVITICVTIVSYLATIYLNLTQYIGFFLWTVSSWISTNIFQSTLTAATNNAGHPLTIFLTFLFGFINVLMPGLIVGFVLRLCKVERAFSIGFIASLLATFVAPIVMIYLYSIVGKFVIELLVIILATVVALWITKRIKKTLYLILIISTLAAVNVFGSPYLNNLLGRPVADAKRADELSKAVATIEFTPYYPTYVPEGLELTPAKFEGYHNSHNQHKRISYEVGKVEFMVSEKLKNQEPVFNKTDNCDISAIWFEMSTTDKISQARADKSRDNLAVCSILGKTDRGDDVYVKANKSQFEFYYMEINSTIIVAKHDKSLKPRYGEDFKEKILKVFNSMVELDKNKLEAGY